MDYYQLLTLDQLEIGRSYELIVSTLSGLYRYQTQKGYQVLIGSETAKQQLGRQSHSQTDDTHTNYDDEQAAI